MNRQQIGHSAVVHNERCISTVSHQAKFAHAAITVDVAALATFTTDEKVTKLHSLSAYYCTQTVHCEGKEKKTESQSDIKQNTNRISKRKKKKEKNEKKEEKYLIKFEIRPLDGSSKRVGSNLTARWQQQTRNFKFYR